MESDKPLDECGLRGRIFRAKRQMSDEEARQFLRERMIAHVGTVDANGWPYVALVRVYVGLANPIDEADPLRLGGVAGHV